MEVKEIFEDWSKKTGIPVDEFQKEFKDYYEKKKKDSPELKEEILTAKALSYVRGTYSRQFQSRAKAFTCYIIGRGDAYDPYKKERDLAIEQGHLNDDGQPLFFDERPSLSWRKGQVIPSPDDDSSLQRIVYGVFKLEGTDKFKPGMLYLNGRKLIENFPEMYTEYKVRLGCKDKELEKPVLTLNTAGVTRFIKTGKKQIDFEKMAKALFPQNIASVDKLEKFNSDAVPLGLFITKGLVVGINLTKDTSADGKPIKSNSIELAVLDEDLEKAKDFGSEEKNTVTVWVSKDYPIDFGIGSEIVVVGTKYLGKDDVSGYNAKGIYVSYNTGPENKPEPITANMKESEKAEEKQTALPPKEKNKEESDEVW